MDSHGNTMSSTHGQRLAATATEGIFSSGPELERQAPCSSTSSVLELGRSDGVPVRARLDVIGTDTIFIDSIVNIRNPITSQHFVNREPMTSPIDPSFESSVVTRTPLRQRAPSVVRAYAAGVTGDDSIPNQHPAQHDSDRRFSARQSQYFPCNTVIKELPSASDQLASRAGHRESNHDRA